MPRRIMRDSKPRNFLCRPADKSFRIGVEEVMGLWTTRRVASSLPQPLKSIS